MNNPTSMKPDAKKFNPDPEYLRELIEGAGLSKNETARALGASKRSIRYWVSGEKPYPYTVQYTIEMLAQFTDR